MKHGPRPFDGYTYRVTRRDGKASEPCHAMPTFTGHGVIMVVPTVDGEGGVLVGGLYDPDIKTVERIGVHNQAWADSVKRGET